MNIRTKISLGFGVVLALLLVLGGYATTALLRLDNTTRRIRQTNVYSVEVGQVLLSAIDQLETQPAAPGGLPLLRQSLQRVADNVTEPGEQTVIDSLAQAADAYQQRVAAGIEPAALAPYRSYLRGLAHRLVDLNVAALERKSQVADRRAAESFRIMLALAALAVVITLGLIIGVAEAAAVPIEELTRALEHASKNNFESTIPAGEYNELGRAGRAFNRLLLELQKFRRTALTEIMTERTRLEGVVSSLDEGLLLLDERGVILLANPAICRLLGRADTELVGRRAAELAPRHELLARMLQPVAVVAGGPDPDEADPDPGATAAADGETAPLITVRISGYDTYYRLSAHELRTFDESGQHVRSAGQLLALRNVSEFKKLDQLKSNFLATVSHELKTPLASIGLSLKLLQHERTDAEERQRLAQGIGQETQRLQRMVGELLTVARLDAGAGIQLSLRPTSLAAVVQRAADTVRPQLDDKRLQLQLELPPDLPPVRADEEKTTWVLINLLSNAIRYSPADAPLHLRARLTADARVQVSVQDQGPGIAPEHHEQIFQRFHQSPEGQVRRGSTGLGLSISREFMTAQGGRLWVESFPGTGSTFHFTLPLA
ncbi:PAS domain-containing protein [Hymenobacter sp. 15J16-1T3B]|uniref:sensor histidine kinase n=1 Tax=Hymenobacter sp. 15J16-1T3B TaxID=2886941 RepID=UPI001D10C9AE|nr:sensor histidine kinase [Hymenobacter sp. 15J16-1T3B]MCC3159047.1 PAS domain-containing protein [Hymenobacter sp. 15J16-1T3B]